MNADLTTLKKPEDKNKKKHKNVPAPPLRGKRCVGHSAGGPF